MKRRGFTLIELMVVIAIIIILAAIAIPNYLNMTARAKKSRVASDFNAIATALESYKTDWGFYPTASGKITDSAKKDPIYTQLAGLDAATGNGPNYTGNTTAAGDSGAIVYMTPSILGSMKNPYTNVLDYYYTYTAPNGNAPEAWRLSAPEAATGTFNWWVRTDTTTNLSESASQ